MNARQQANEMVGRNDETVYITEEYINELEKEMLTAAEELDFERAASLRDRIGVMRDSIGKPMSQVKESKSGGKGRGRRKKRRGTKVPRPRKKSS